MVADCLHMSVISRRRAQRTVPVTINHRNRVLVGVRYLVPSSGSTVTFVLACRQQ